MQIPLYQVDAFTSRPFGGNPAAVCPLKRWLDDATLQAIAAENNLSETAFFVPGGEGFHLRWFTPAVEVKLCGHATLASGHVVFTRLDPKRDKVRFMSRSGPLEVAREGDRLVLDFPAIPLKTRHEPGMVAEAFGAVPVELWEADRAMAVFERAEQVAALAPDPARIAALPFGSIIATAPGQAGDADFVSRYFAPKAGVPEDPVTGSAHCVLTPYWAKRLGKSKMFARQISRRGGELWVEDRGARVRIAGHCAAVLEGKITL
jgi:predicted PhzF superfamily epimerase YddE/YHI9